MAEVIAPRHSVVPRDRIERLGAGGSKLPGPQQRILRLRPGGVEFQHGLAHPVHRVVDLFGPAAHFRAALVPLAGVVEIAEIEIALGQVEGRTGIVGFSFHLGQQQVSVAGVLLRVEIASADTSRIDVVVAVEPDSLMRRVARHELVHHAFVAPWHAVAEELRTPVGEAARWPVVQVVDRFGETAQIGRADHQVVGVDYPDVVGASGGKIQGLGSVVAEILPRAVDEFAGDSQAGHMCADDILGAVVGSGVDDGPGRNIGGDAVQHLMDDVGFVADDHVQTDRRWSRLHTFFYPNRIQCVRSTRPKWHYTSCAGVPEM